MQRSIGFDILPNAFLWYSVEARFLWFDDWMFLGRVVPLGDMGSTGVPIFVKP